MGEGDQDRGDPTRLNFFTRVHVRIGAPGAAWHGVGTGQAGKSLEPLCAKHRSLRHVAELIQQE